MSAILHNKFEIKCTHYYAERCQGLIEKVHSQYLSGCKSISMEVVPLEHFNKLKLSTIPMAQFHYYLSYKSDQDSSTTATRTHILLRFFLTKGMIAPFLTTMWDHTGCASAIYLLSCLALEFYIIIYRSVGAHLHAKCVVDGLNTKYKRMIKLPMEKLLNPVLIRDDSIVFKFMQVNGNEEDKSISLAK